MRDHELSDYYDRECEAARELGVCHECHYGGGLHNEGACSRFRLDDALDDEMESDDA